MSERVRATITVGGRVQGVFFRAETRRTAVSLGLGGWVRNMPDGTVKAVFEGEREDVERAVEWCRKGPPAAKVDQVDVEWGVPLGEKGFTIAY